MTLKVDTYDPTPTLDGLVEEARYVLGEPVWRMTGPEVEGFIRCMVRTALTDAFSAAERQYIRDQIKFANQASATLLEGVLAGCKLAERAGE